ncbi:hypothetical protein DL96DRAFT_1625761 [Flagelloscypha sp. PMI_526]|nr:hypothetical protein DL96DRAFT_1625761 [Flagelloscypha sp. PMI_526]
MLQLVTGHGILLNTHHGGIHLGPWKEEPIWHSVVVGLLGGAILSPLVYGIVLLLLYTRRPDDTTQEGFGHGTGDGAIMVNGRLIHRPSTHVPEDFFDDESRYKHGGLTLVRSQTTFTFGAWRLLALIATGLLLGVLTGALGGVIALRALSAEFGVGIVDVEGWALTGTVGGVVVTLGGGALAVAVRILVAWCFSAAI